MAEYQFYEFRTVNRALTRAEQAEVNTWSSRANVTPSGATFVYNYGDFKKDPERCLLSHFDMMLYVANYGCRRMMFRFPADLVDFEAMQAYVWEHEEDYEHYLRVYQKEGYVVVDIEENAEEGYGFWVEGEGILPALASLWTDIANGNYACLYLAWVHFAAYFQEIMDDSDEQDGDEDAPMTEPPLALGLKKPSAALSEFMEFWGISDDLRAAAAQNSPAEDNAPAAELEQGLQRLPEAEKTAFLARLLRDEPHLRIALVKRLQEVSGTAAAQPAADRRSLRVLQEAEAAASKQRMEREQREAAEKRRLELEAMKKREPAIWAAMEANLFKKTSSGYDHAVKELVDLRDLADYNKARPQFEEKMADILERFGRSSALKERLKNAKLI